MCELKGMYEIIKYGCQKCAMVVKEGDITIRKPCFLGRQKKRECAFTLTWKSFSETSPKIRHARQEKNAS